MSADGKRVVILHVQPRAEAMEDESAELRVIDVATDRVVERIRASADATDRDKVERMNARLDHGTWTPLVEGEVLEHPHGQERDTDERNCESSRCYPRGTDSVQVTT